jgi:hypothetical protein
MTAVWGKNAVQQADVSEVRTASIIRAMMMEAVRIFIFAAVTT